MVARGAHAEGMMSLLPALAGQAAPHLEVVLPLALLWDRFEFSNRVHDCLGLKERFEYFRSGCLPSSRQFSARPFFRQHLDSANCE